MHTLEATKLSIKPFRIGDKIQFKAGSGWGWGVVANVDYASGRVWVRTLVGSVCTRRISKVRHPPAGTTHPHVARQPLT